MRTTLLLFYVSVLWLNCQSGAAPEVQAAPPVAVAAQEPTLDKAQLMGKFNPATDPDFVTVGKPYSAKPGMSLRKEAFEAFQKMWEAAKKDGITLHVISSTRNFEQQKKIWEGKWERYAAETPDPQKRALRILEYSSMPGTSRHHWGTDIDLNDLNNGSFEGKGLHKKAYDWLAAHAAEYGFGQPYTPKGEERPHGYNEEKWHWSYLPLAKKYRNAFLKTIQDGDITGFKGAETAVPLQVTERYVGGVGAFCR